MAGLVPFEVGVVQLGEFRGRKGGRVGPYVGAQCGEEFPDEVPCGVAAHAEHAVVAARQEVQRVTVRSDAVRVHVPTAVRAPARAEAVGDLVAERDPVRGGACGGVGLGDDHLFVGELGEHLGQQARLAFCQAAESDGVAVVTSGLLRETEGDSVGRCRARACQSRSRRARSRIIRAARLPGSSTSAEKRKPAVRKAATEGVAQVGLRDDPAAGRPVVEDQFRDGTQQGAAQAVGAVGDAADEQVQAGVVRPGRVEAGDRVEVGAVDLPVAHGCAVEDAEAGQAAAVAVQLRAQMGLRDIGATGELPEFGDCRIVHPPRDQGEVPGHVDRYQPEGPGGRGRGGPARDTVEQVGPGRRTDPLDSVRRPRRGGGEEGEDLGGQFQIESVLGAGVG